MSPIKSQRAFNPIDYIKLGRIFDNEAREGGYQDFPDDLLSLVFDYSANMSVKPWNLFKIKMEMTVIRPYQVIKPNGEIEWKESRNTTWDFIYHCPSCYRFFINKPTNHKQGVRHKLIDKPYNRIKLMEDAFKAIKAKRSKRFYGNDTHPPPRYINPRKMKEYDIGMWM